MLATLNNFISKLFFSGPDDLQTTDIFSCQNWDPVDKIKIFKLYSDKNF